MKIHRWGKQRIPGKVCSSNSQGGDFFLNYYFFKWSKYHFPPFPFSLEATKKLKRERIPYTHTSNRSQKLAQWNST